MATLPVNNSWSSESPPTFAENPVGHSVGDILELVHIIGRFLKLDEDYQSLGRMVLSCKAYKQDLDGLLQPGKGKWAEVNCEELREMPSPRLRLVRSVKGFYVSYSKDLGFLGVDFVQDNPTRNRQIELGLVGLAEITHGSAGKVWEEDETPPRRLRPPFAATLKHMGFVTAERDLAYWHPRQNSLGNRLSHDLREIFGDITLLFGKLERFSFRDHAAWLQDQAGRKMIDSDRYWHEASWPYWAVYNHTGIKHVSHIGVNDAEPWTYSCEVLTEARGVACSRICAYEGHLDGMGYNGTDDFSSSIESLPRFINGLTSGLGYLGGCQLKRISVRVEPKPNVTLNKEDHLNVVSNVRDHHPLWSDFAQRVLHRQSPWSFSKPTVEVQVFRRVAKGEVKAMQAIYTARQEGLSLFNSPPWQVEEIAWKESH